MFERWQRVVLVACSMLLLHLASAGTAAASEAVEMNAEPAGFWCELNCWMGYQGCMDIVRHEEYCLVWLNNCLMGQCGE